MKSSHGFTLIEVLVALVLVAILVTSCWVSLYHVTHSLQRINKVIPALWVADSVLTQKQAGLLQGQSHGQMQEWGSDYRWQAQGDNAALGIESICVSPVASSATCVASLQGVVDAH